MSRDMKPRKSQPARKKAAGGTLIGMFIGLVLGVALAAGVVWYINKSPLPFVERVQHPPKAEEKPAAKPAGAQQAATPAPAAAPAQAQPAAQQPASLPGKPGDPVPEKRFQFYDILPGKAEAVPDKAAKPTAKEAGKSEPGKPEAARKDDVKKEETKKDEPKEARKDEPKKEEARKDDGKDSKTPLFLQAGAFSTAQDADNQKAKLAFMGHEAVVQQVMTQDKTLYRVRVGPFMRVDELNKVRAELAKSGIDAQLSK